MFILSFVSTDKIYRIVLRDTRRREGDLFDGGAVQLHHEHRERGRTDRRSEVVIVRDTDAGPVGHVRQE